MPTDMQERNPVSTKFLPGIIGYSLAWQIVDLLYSDT